jgi:hypothetical protein
MCECFFGRICQPMGLGGMDDAYIPAVASFAEGGHVGITWEIA